MSYSLELYFEPAVQQSRILQYFSAREHFAVAENDVFYENPHTGVYFSIKLRCAGNILFQKNVVSAEFEVNYHRPSYFGTEAERALSDFVTAFQPRIDDPQIRGMGEGPYSREGFLNGWNFGNLFAVRSGLLRDFDLKASMPTESLRATWEWNYHIAERKKWRKNRCLVPTIMFFIIEEHPCRVVVWPRGEAVLLPVVDYVLIGRLVLGEPRFGLASWSQALEVVQRAGFDTAKDPLELEYIITPPPIAEWVANMPLIDLDAPKLQRLHAYQILDDELIVAARESIERDQGTSDHT
jgi:hypothetical protein